MSSGILYQDENITILRPGDPRGVELIHTIGYMSPIEGTANNSGVFAKIRRNGLKSSKQLLTETGVSDIPTNRNRAEESDSFNVRLRKSYLQYDPHSMSRIFFRPPSTAPYKFEGGAFVSAGNWRDFRGHPREHRLFFGGESYTDSMQYTAEPGNIAEGLVSIRVDPEKTYVFYEAMKDIYNRNRNTGIPMPHRQGEPAADPQGRYQASKMKLSDYLDFLQANPGKVQYGYEVLATTPRIDPSFFEKIIANGDTTYDTPQEVADSEVKRKGQRNEAERLGRGDTMKMEMWNILIPLETRAKAIRSATSELDKQIHSSIKTVRLKRERIEAALARLDALGPLTQESAMEALRAEIRKFQNPEGQPKRSVHPLQKQWMDILFKEQVLDPLKRAREIRQKAVDTLRTLAAGGGKKTRRHPTKRSKTRRTN